MKYKIAYQIVRHYKSTNPVLDTKCVFLPLFTVWQLMWDNLQSTILHSTIRKTSYFSWIITVTKHKILHEYKSCSWHPYHYLRHYTNQLHHLMFDAIRFVTLDSNKQSTHIFKMENNRGQIYSAFLHMP